MRRHDPAEIAATSAPTEIPAAMIGVPMSSDRDFWAQPPRDPRPVPPEIPSGRSAWEDEIVGSGTDPAPAEVIAVLELIDVTYGRRGPSLRGKQRKRALDAIAIEKIDRGEPFIYHGRRFPGAGE